MSGSAAADADGGANKVQVKRQIRSIVEDLENILGDLKDVAKELKEVVQEIDCLTSDLHLEEDGSKTDTLNSSSSSTTASSIKIYPEEPAVLRRAGPSEAMAGPTHAGRCSQATRERVRFSEKVQYHGYRPDWDPRCDGTELHLRAEMMEVQPLENGFPAQKPHKTILRKSTSTTV